MDKPQYQLLRKIVQNGNVINSTDYLKLEIVEIDDAIKLIRRLPKKLLIFSREIITYLDIKEVFDKDEDSK